MKRILFVLLATVVLTMVFAFSALAVKPAANLAGNANVPWNLSADVMPAPPYGSFDIPGSDTASKLNVNQPNGNTEVTITGIMNGLAADTEYTVYLSNGYTPYTSTGGWNVEGISIITMFYDIDYPHTSILVQDGTSITGGSLNYSGWPKTIDSGSVIGNVISIDAYYTNNIVEEFLLDGTIAPDGSMSGTWSDSYWGPLRYGTWESTSGNAVNHTGDIGWTGLFTSTVQPFTFTTDEFGAGSWHINLQDADFPGPGTYELSIWIDTADATLLISDTFGVVVD